MDGLFSKYARPFDFVDLMIEQKRLCEFINETLKLEEEKKTWDFYLHKVYDKSYDDFVSSLNKQDQETPKEQIETTVKDSANILAGFIPKEGG